MTTKLLAVLFTITAISAANVFAQEGTSKAEGTLLLDKKTYTLKNALAYETTIDGEEVVAVVLTAQPVKSEQLKAAKAKDKEGNSPSFRPPFLRLVFKKTGEIKEWSAAGGTTSLGGRSSGATAELQQQDGRVMGKASAAVDPKAMFPTSFDVHFETSLLKAADSLPTTKKGGPAANIPPTVTGSFKGNGKDAKLAYVSAHWREPFDGKTGISLVFTEKDHSKDKKPDTGAMFGRFGSALIISLTEEGQIFSCQVVHSAHQKQGFSSIGNIEAPEFTYGDGRVEGELTTNGEVDTFGEKWDVKLKFAAPLGETPKEFQVAESKKPESSSKSTATDADDDDDDDKPADDKAGAKPATPGLNAKDLALTKDAADVEYKALVQQLSFKSKADVKKACGELATNLKAQGWTTQGSDMVNAQSSILRRKRGEAELTIFVKPADGGSEVKMMTQGLTWE